MSLSFNCWVFLASCSQSPLITSCCAADVCWSLSTILESRATSSLRLELATTALKLSSRKASSTSYWTWLIVARLGKLENEKNNGRQQMGEYFLFTHVEVEVGIGSRIWFWSGSCHLIRERDRLGTSQLRCSLPPPLRCKEEIQEPSSLLSSAHSSI